MEKIALDTSICIALLKDSAFAGSFTQNFHENMPFLPAIAAFELLLRRHSLDTVESFFSKVELLDFNEASARKAAEISKDLRSRGEAVGSHDIFIAATAIVNNCAIATLDTKDFSKIKGLKIVKI